MADSWQLTAEHMAQKMIDAELRTAEAYRDLKYLHTRFTWDLHPDGKNCRLCEKLTAVFA